MRRDTGARLRHLLVWLVALPAVLLSAASSASAAPDAWGVWGLSGGELPRLLAVASLAALAGLVVLAATRAVRTDGASAVGHVRTALRDRTSRTAFLPQRDPDAAGRPRPRAPGRATSLSH
ncbi:hypothetical protein DZF91_24885 [Actinomadura logoneensis]|uniref:Uncharacterized protein n=1 Tax=Actinomadura logoneensis TaxID=2293572 RepID=A0A372JGD2_9ACTN|nr:DUF6412 domain-containing protein [Actinomadura logoneensis]RFU38969.1 hypothetical protein DZF91_24885 [Actinomadura logoneensis]